MGNISIYNSRPYPIYVRITTAGHGFQVKNGGVDAGAKRTFDLEAVWYDIEIVDQGTNTWKNGVYAGSKPTLIWPADFTTTVAALSVAEGDAKEAEDPFASQEALDKAAIEYVKSRKLKIEQ